ncbi:beta-galactoside alpha-2,6-sialyltransferase 1 [Euwallacea fornicatus]|uniref:beta-galactoside alpha-2,6-sialyltransferase 1 n=1 Tax=Euwallacea fornicatus TaxID=995702 RepID=UPI00338D445F
MKCSITNFIFINLLVIGMGGYLYMVWSRRWTTPQRQDMPTTSPYDREIYLYNRGYHMHLSNETLFRSKHSLPRPKIPSSNPHKVALDSTEFRCLSNDSEEDCSKKTAKFKELMLIHLSNSFEEESNVLKHSNNTYNVHYEGIREDFRAKSAKQVLCELLNTKFKTLKKSDINEDETLRNSMPKREFFENKYFNSCVMVTNAGALRHSDLGRFIDSHEVVLRFNHAPTRHFNHDVGSKTTVRVLNSQVVTRPEFKFLTSPLYKNLTLVVWDPSNYSASLEEWLKRPEHNFIPNLMAYRKQEARPRIFMVNPLTVWDVWDFLQRNSPKRLRKNPPSSGFLGLRLLLPHCSFVDVVEYVPSTRASKRCHYFDPKENPACTFGAWHPLAAEKLLTYHFNDATDDDVFQKGFVRVSGFRNLKC